MTIYITVPQRWRVWNVDDNHEQCIEAGRYEMELRVVETDLGVHGKRKATFWVIKGTPLGCENHLWEWYANSPHPERRVIIERE